VPYADVFAVEVIGQCDCVVRCHFNLTEAKQTNNDLSPHILETANYMKLIMHC